MLPAMLEGSSVGLLQSPKKPPENWVGVWTVPLSSANLSEDHFLKIQNMGHLARVYCLTTFGTILWGSSHPDMGLTWDSPSPKPIFLGILASGLPDTSPSPHPSTFSL